MSNTLNTQARDFAYDDFYEALIATHQGLSTEDSHALNARLVLLLANHIGDMAVLQQALNVARGSALTAETVRAAEQAAITPVAPSHTDT
ncbi:MAG: DUF2783 domain-containing protein [Macromonas bipunctata]|nr:DUF2783 domain-containing protein [Macromonas bipunctata]